SCNKLIVSADRKTNLFSPEDVLDLVNTTFLSERSISSSLMFNASEILIPDSYRTLTNSIFLIFNLYWNFWFNCSSDNFLYVVFVSFSFIAFNLYLTLVFVCSRKDL